MNSKEIQKIQVVDSHTGGEPTRVVLKGFPDLGKGSMSQRLELLKAKYDDYRSAVVNEPRASEVVVGALICEAEDTKHSIGVIFFNNAGYLGMCGHGMMGVMVTLYDQGRIDLGEHLIETPVGLIKAELLDENTAVIHNVVSYRVDKDLVLDLPSKKQVKGDYAWGGNWFYITADHGLEIDLKNVKALSDCAEEIKEALIKNKNMKQEDVELLHIELYQPSKVEGVDVKNFVYCPGGEYDRSPCGTGTSAKMACLQADGKMKEGDVWRQESIVGSVFEGQITVKGGELHPQVKGQAYICAETQLILKPNDPFRTGISS